MVGVSIIAFFTMLNLQHNSPAVILGYMGRKSPLQPKQFFVTSAYHKSLISSNFFFSRGDVPLFARDPPLWALFPLLLLLKIVRQGRGFKMNSLFSFFFTSPFLSPLLLLFLLPSPFFLILLLHPDWDSLENDPSTPAVSNSKSATTQCARPV